MRCSPLAVCCALCAVGCYCRPPWGGHLQGLSATADRVTGLGRLHPPSPLPPGYKRASICKICYCTSLNLFYIISRCIFQPGLRSKAGVKSWSLYLLSRPLLREYNVYLRDFIITSFMPPHKHSHTRKYN